MNTKIFTSLPQDAKDIHIEVFMNEQGFENEFDEIDTISPVSYTHLTRPTIA